MSQILEETDANGKLSVVKTSRNHVKQKSSSKKSENGIAFKADNMAAPAKQSKKNETSAEESDQEKETIIQEVLGYMLGNSSSVASSSRCRSSDVHAPPEEEFSPICPLCEVPFSSSATNFSVYQSPLPKHLNSATFAQKHYLTTIDNNEKSRKPKIIVEKQDKGKRESHIKKLHEYASRPTTSVAFTEQSHLLNTFEEEPTPPLKQKAKFVDSKPQHTCKTHKKSFGEKYSLDNRLCLAGKEMKCIAKTLSSPNRRSRHRERKRYTQLLQSDKIDLYVMQQHQNITSESAISRVQTYLTSGKSYWPRVLISSHLNDIFCRIRTENDNV